MRKPIRPIRFEGNIGYVPLTKGYEAIIDAADAHLVDKWNWFVMVSPSGDYAARFDVAIKRVFRMHRVIIDIPPGLVCDHINGSTLDNRRENLRPASLSENAQNIRKSSRNTSGFKGVHWDKAEGKWQARICKGGLRISLGYYRNLEDAAAAYAEASERIHGEFGRIE